MLHPKNDRLDYGEQLIPPDGYELNYAVGTTYTLDLEALMIIPVALFYSQTLDTEAEGIRYDMLDALTKASEKISIFCQKGKIKVPDTYHYLMAYWEKGIEEIAMKSEASSFHPKVWVIRFVKDKSPTIFRLLVTSRNLTFARDWDVAFSTEGKTGDKQIESNLPLVQFITYLEHNSKRKFPKGFIQELSKVSFDIPAPFRSVGFYPIGIQTADKLDIYVNPLRNIIWNNLLIISPFVDESTMQFLKGKIKNKKWIFSRKDELDSLPDSVLSPYISKQFSQFLVSAEYLDEMSENNNMEPLPQNLHAKLFVGQSNDEYHWFLGSANCSAPALEARNIEFLVHLSGQNYDLNPGKIVASLTEIKQGEIALFETYDAANKTSTEEQKKLDLSLRKIIFNLTRIPIKGQASIVEGGSAYNLVIEVDATKLKIPEKYSVRMKPLPEKDKLAKEIVPGIINRIESFTGYSEIQLSPFIQWEIWEGTVRHKQFLIRIDIELPETRFKRIFTSVINSREKFLKYLTFLLLGEEPELIDNTPLENESATNQSIEQKMGNWAFQGVPVFEKLLIAASRYPKKLESIDRLIQYLKSETAETGEQIVTEDFENLWGVFKKYRENSK
jgi:hypothetical protein